MEVKGGQTLQWKKGQTMIQKTLHRKLRESVNQGMTHNTMEKRKRTKRQTMIYKTLHRKRLKFRRYQRGNQNPEDEE